MNSQERTQKFTSHVKRLGVPVPSASITDGFPLQNCIDLDSENVFFYSMELSHSPTLKLIIRFWSLLDFNITELRFPSITRRICVAGKVQRANSPDERGEQVGNTSDT